MEKDRLLWKGDWDIMRIKSLISNIILVFLLIVFVIGITICISEIGNYNDNYYMEEDSFLYAIQEKDYSRLVEISKLHRAVNGVEEKFTPYHAVADYFEAATFYKAYMKMGDEEQAKKEKEIMDNNFYQMGEFSYLSEEIIKDLDISPK